MSLCVVRPGSGRFGVGFWVGFRVGLRARDSPTEEVLSRTPLIIRTVDQYLDCREVSKLLKIRNRSRTNNKVQEKRDQQNQRETPETKTEARFWQFARRIQQLNTDQQGLGKRTACLANSLRRRDRVYDAANLLQASGFAFSSSIVRCPQQQ